MFKSKLPSYGWFYYLKRPKRWVLKKVSYKFETTLNVPYFSENDEITPISVLPVSQKILKIMYGV